MKTYRKCILGKTTLTETDVKTINQKQKEQYKIDKCLNCTKPAKECKGSCFGV